jgi:hypothetical protein
VKWAKKRLISVSESQITLLRTGAVYYGRNKSAYPHPFFGWLTSRLNDDFIPKDGFHAHYRPEARKPTNGLQRKNAEARFTDFPVWDHWSVKRASEHFISNL